MQFINNQQVKTRGVNKVKVLPLRIKEWLKWKSKNQNGIPPDQQNFLEQVQVIVGQYQFQ